MLSMQTLCSIYGKWNRVQAYMAVVKKNIYEVANYNCANGL